MDHPSESVNETILESRPAAGWIPTLLEWGAVPRLIDLMNWPNQADTRPWPGAQAAAGDTLQLHLHPPAPSTFFTSGRTISRAQFRPCTSHSRIPTYLLFLAKS